MRVFLPTQQVRALDNVRSLIPELFTLIWELVRFLKEMHERESAGPRFEPWCAHFRNARLMWQTKMPRWSPFVSFNGERLSQFRLQFSVDLRHFRAVADKSSQAAR